MYSGQKEVGIMRYRREKKHISPQIKALADAQKIAFAPLTFQAVSAMLKFGILEFLEENPSTVEEIIEHCHVSKYAVETLLEVACASGLVLQTEGKYVNTLVASAFLNNEMTKVNFNFVKDVCYLGASELASSYETSEPLGCRKFIGDYETIYNALQFLPDEMKKSWFGFDHFYSDRCFEEVLKIIFEDKLEQIFDIGGNTGKFERACLEFDKDCIVNMIDLPENIEEAKKHLSDERLKFHGVDVLKSKLPEISGAVFMSQFLDCFSEEQIISILTNIKNSMVKGTKIYILEPFTDKQIFEGAQYSLVHISLYFTCMANGKSRMYTEKRMLELVEKAGLKLHKKYDNIGVHDYTLLEVRCK